MNKDEYFKHDKSISMLKANLLGFILAVPLLVLPSVVFIWIWDFDRYANGLNSIFAQPLHLLAGFVILIIAHELIHGITWQWTSNFRLRDIHYGVKWKTITPYAHLKKPIDIQPYRMGTAMPGIVLGILPATLALIIGSGSLFWVGVFMIMAASGDMMVFYLLRDVEKPALVEDHPDRVGCYVLVPKD